MATSTANVVAGKPVFGGGIYHAPLGTALPTDSTTALDAAFKSYGYCDDTGVVETPTRTNTPINAWGGDMVKNLSGAYTKTFAVTFIEARNHEVLGSVYGEGNVTSTAATATTGTLYAALDKGDPLPYETFVIDTIDGLGSERIVIENGQITDIGAITYSDAAVVAYPVTITAYRGTVTGAFSAKYGDDGITTA